jgi:hypothetical protein
VEEESGGMTTAVEFEALRGIMPPHAGAGESVDWAAIEASWGHSFPADYRRFMAEYGGGGIENYLGILPPEPYEPKAQFTGMSFETRNARVRWEERPGDPKLVAGPGSLLAWGVNSSADLLCWRTDGPDPDTWPVVVWNEDDFLWTAYDTGMAGFLLRMFRAEWEECPLGAISLWDVSEVVFLSTREEDRFWAAGLDPWTGEPDPYAGAEYS